MLSELAGKLKESSTLAITAKAKKLKKEGKDVVGFGAGEPDFDTPDFIKQAAVDALNQGATKYTPASGMPELKKAVIDKFKRENGLSYGPDEVIVNCGAKHALFNVMMCAAGPGDEVIIPAPYWVSYPEMVTASGATPVIADCFSSDFKLTPGTLEKKMTPRTRLVVINSPSNPSGSVYTKDELAALAEVISGHDITVVSDEIYEHLVYEKGFYSIAAVSEEMKQKTIVVNGVSKAYSMTGWRIGYAAGNRELIAACGRLQSHSTSNPTTFAQHGAICALSSDSSAGFILKMKEEFRKRRDYVYEELSSISGLAVKRPEGAFYIFPEISGLFRNGIRTSHEFALRLLDEKLVALVPGEGFGAPGYIRISYATGMKELSKGLSRIKDFVRTA